MSAPVLQAAVNAGEISPSLYGRVDLPKYRAGCSTLRNMWVSYRGGAASRGGTKFCSQSMQSGTDVAPHLIPFQFNVSQGYALEFGGGYMRVFANGGAVTETGFAISGITQASPGVLTAAGNNFSVNDWVNLASITGMTELNGVSYAVASIPTTGSFTLKSTLTGTAISTATMSAYVSGGTAARIFTMATPYASADVRAIKWAQSADVMSLVHPSYAPRDLTRVSLANWTLAQTTFTSAIAAPLTCTATATTTTSSLATQYAYEVTAVDTETDDESPPSPQANVTNSVNIATTLGASNIAWASVTGASRYNIYKAPPSYNATVPVGSLFGYLGTSFGLSFSDTNITPDLSITPPKHLNPFAPGQIDYLTPTATGSGYSATIPPTVLISDPTGSGAAFDAVVVGTGVFGYIQRDAGINYSNPSVAVAYSGAGSGATFTANPNGSGLWDGGGNVTVNTTGSGYNTPLVLATYPLSGNTVSIIATSVSVSAGHITAVTFQALPSGQKPVAAQVSIRAQDSIGTGAAATAHVSPSSGTYPSCVTYFQDRRYYAGSLNQPDTYWGSQPGSFTNMDTSIPVVASDALSGTPWAQQVNGIQAMVPMPGGLVILTGQGAWQLSGGAAGAAVTPIDQIATPQAYNGCAPLMQPITINYDILYVQSKGSIVRDLSYNFFVNIYTGTDITVYSNHLFDGKTLIDWDWAAEPNKLLWVVRSDGALLCLTFLKEQEVYAWSRHDTQGQFEAVCCVSEPPVDAAYFVVKRNINGTAAYYIERMDNRIWPTIESCWCVDAGLSLTQPAPAATLSASAANGTANIGSYTIVFGGTGYTAPVGQITDTEGLGTGATVALTVSGGVITSATPVLQGSGYVRPELMIFDTSGTGAVINPIVTNHVTFTASAGVFTAQNVGDVIRMGGGVANVVTYSSSTSVIANVVQPIALTTPNDPNNIPIQAASGNWTITTPVTKVHALNHLEGMAVVALADGSVVDNLTVTNGAVTLAAAASNIVVGLPFAVQLQTLYLEVPGEMTSQTRRKTAAQVGLRVENSRAPEVGFNQPDQATQPNGASPAWTNMSQAETRDPSVFAGRPAPLFTGDYITGLKSNWGENAQIAVQQLQPVPLTLLSLVPWVDLGDTPG